MGCGGSKETQQMSIEQQFVQANLNRFLLDGQFESPMEKEIFMAINLCRFMPQRFIPIVQKVKMNFPEAQMVQGTKMLIKHMRNMQRISGVTFSEEANRACRERNDVVCSSPMVEEGMVIPIYHRISHSETPCNEYTHKQFNGTSGADFVALQLILDWGIRGKSPILERFVTHLGISMRSHKEFSNVTQVLYVK